MLCVCIGLFCIESQVILTSAACVSVLCHSWFIECVELLVRTGPDREQTHCKHADNEITIVCHSLSRFVLSSVGHWLVGFWHAVPNASVFCREGHSEKRPWQMDHEFVFLLLLLVVFCLNYLVFLVDSAVLVRTRIIGKSCM